MKYLISIIALFLLSCGKEPVKVHVDWDGNVLDTGKFHSLLESGVEMKPVDTIQNKDSIIYRFFAYDQRIGFSDLKRLLYKKSLKPFNLETLDQGVEFSDFNLKPTMLTIWNVNCGPCIAEFPDLNDLKKKYADQMNFIAIARDNAVGVRNLLKKHPLDFIHFVNGEKYIQSIGIDGYPVNLFIDSHGTIVEVKEGAPIQTNENGDPGSTWNILAFEEYSPIIDKLLASEKSILH